MHACEIGSCPYCRSSLCNESLHVVICFESLDVTHCSNIPAGVLLSTGVVEKESTKTFTYSTLYMSRFCRLNGWLELRHCFKHSTLQRRLATRPLVLQLTLVLLLPLSLGLIFFAVFSSSISCTLVRLLLDINDGDLSVTRYTKCVVDQMNLLLMRAAALIDDDVLWLDARVWRCHRQHRMHSLCDGVCVLQTSLWDVLRDL